MFKFLKKKIKLTAYTDDNSFIHNFPPVYRDKKNPWFFKTIKPTAVPEQYSGIAMPHTTALTCPGIKDFVYKGIQLCMWQDVAFKVRPEGIVTFLDVVSLKQGIKSTAATVHPKGQYGDLYGNDRIAVKLNSPWFFNTEEDIDFVWVESHYSTNFFRNLGITIPPGIINFKKQFSTNVHINVPVKETEYDFVIKAGTPLVTIFPMSERPVDIQYELRREGLFQISSELTTLPRVFKNAYGKQK